MKETISVNLASQAFTFDKDAYRRLKEYLDAIRRRLPAGDPEILNDVEARLAEIFRSRISSPMMVVTLQMVQQANAEIGIGYCPTITAAAGMAGNNQPILFDNHGPDTRYSGPVKVAQTITSALGTGGNNTPLAVHGEPY